MPWERNDTAEESEEGEHREDSIGGTVVEVNHLGRRREAEREAGNNREDRNGGSAGDS
jgi:hypothetical protein